MTKAEQITAEIEALRDDSGIVHAERIVDWAREHPDSALHGQFEWNDDEAARQYRIWQARRVIAIFVQQPPGQRRLISLSIDRPKGGGYRFLEDVAADQSLYSVAYEDAMQELRRVRTKFEHIKELGAVWDAVDAADARLPTLWPQALDPPNLRRIG